MLFYLGQFEICSREVCSVPYIRTDASVAHSIAYYTIIDNNIINDDL